MSYLDEAKELYRQLIPLKIRWVSQASINVAHDDELLHLLRASGCQGLLIGFESLNPENLRKMHKSFNTMKGGYSVALENLRRHGMRLYVTFIVGYDGDSHESLRARKEFYRFGSIWRRSLDAVNSGSAYIGAKFFTINWLIRREVTQRRDYPLGHEDSAGRRFAWVATHE